jgi:radical SAM protein with 4Fe4S-binding SPASM domain
VEAKKFIKNKSVCVLPWTGFFLETDGRVRSCVAQNPNTSYGNIQSNTLENILNNKEVSDTKQQMLLDKKPKRCNTCYIQEQNQKKLVSISSRLYYAKEIAPHIDLKLLDNINEFELRHVDLRWNNTCNQACVYCDATSSSMWAQELGESNNTNRKANQKVKQFVFDHVDKFLNVYLAGGEPLLIKENLEFLKLIKEKNPNCNIRINTNLSKTDTGIFELLCEFPNVHWTVSCETIDKEYEYVRYHGVWDNFISNLKRIQLLNHKISFNMLHMILNYNSILDCVDHLKSFGFHDNSFIIGPLTGPLYFSVRHLPKPVLEETIAKFEARLLHSTDYLKNSLQNCIDYMKQPHTKNIQLFNFFVNKLDKRRSQDWKKTFPKLAEVLDV